MLNELLCDIISERGKNFGGCSLVIANTREKIKVLKETTGLDYRVRLAETDAIGSSFSGIEFDTEKTRTFSVGIFDDEVPIGVLSIVIAPRSIFSKEKYYKISPDGSITIQTFQNCIDPDMPEYLISPAWAKLKEEYRPRIGYAFVNLTRHLTLVTIEKCPETAGIEVIAQGQLIPASNIPYLLDSSRFIVGQVIDPKKLGLDVSQIGVARKESVGSEKFARILGLERCEGVGQVLTLGSVFYKRMK